MAILDLYTPQNNLSRFSTVRSNKILGESAQNAPFFSIVIPTFKRGDLIIQSLQSAIDQKDFEDYEIVIIDNNPDIINNVTRNAIIPFMNEKMTYYVNDENIGICGNWNRCIELAKGKYVVMLHDDDVLAPAFLKSVHQVIVEEHEPGIVGVGFKIFSKANTIDFDEVGDPKREWITKTGFFFNHTINITGMTFKRDLAHFLGGFSPNFAPNIDTCFIYQGLIYSNVINIKQTLAGYRIESNDSLNGNTMRDIIVMTQRMREAIAVHEFAVKLFMTLFDSEFLYLYGLGANEYWNLKLNVVDLLKETQLKRKKISLWRLTLLNFVMRLSPYIIKLLEFRYKAILMNEQRKLEESK